MGRLFKSKSELPEWYPLPVYERDLTGEEWLTELALRFGIHQMLKNGAEIYKVKDAFSNVIINNIRGRESLVDTPDSPGELWGIKELSAFEFLYLAEMANSSTSSKEPLEKIKVARTEKSLSDLILSPSPIEKLNRESFSDYIEWENEPFDMPDVIPRFPITVDLDQDDETLELAFKIWLAGVRGEMGEAKKPFSSKDFIEWKKFGVLPAFDLKLWATLNGGKYTNKLLADTLWPLDEEDTTERLRKVTVKKIDFLLHDWSNLGRLWKQVALSKSLNSLLAEKAE
ncbi:TPA: hypothetical protein KD131_004746 [Vibrio parahaemolyticus]|nr:hypothetical protein [Vibrio parahaemolyticus]ELA9727707.1 hypothetical protein [Vibrio parahaemolyticus]HBC3612711.1 hypothetical protein [Vibrio parahaemolyticus]